MAASLFSRIVSVAYMVVPPSILLLICLDVFHKQIEVVFIDRRRLKPVLAIESLGLLVLGVNEDGSATDDVRCLRGASEGVL
jgi:hypothetical protein